MPTVKVKFLSGLTERLYSYTAPEGPWKTGDLAIVDSPSAGFTVVGVESYDPLDYSGNKPVVGMVSLDSYNQYKADLARKQEILAQLERANKARAETDRFGHLRSDPALASLLDELEKLK